MAQKMFFLVFFHSLAFISKSGLGAKVMIEPMSFFPGLTPNISITCMPGDTESQGSQILLIQIVKNFGELAAANPMATVGPAITANIDTSLRGSKFSATGIVDNTNIPLSFLLFMISFPEVDDIGSYACLMSYLDGAGTLVQSKEQFNLLTNTSSDASLQSQLTVTLQTVDNLLARVQTLEEQAFSLQSENKNQSANIASLVDKSNNEIGFYATFSDQIIIYLNDVLIFDDVKLNEGNGYNNTTGIFTAPISGLYSFSLVFEVDAPTVIKMDVTIQVDTEVISRLFVFGDDNLNGGQASGTVMYRVAAGSQVKACVGMLTMQVESQPRLVHERKSYFSGFLLK